MTNYTGYGRTHEEAVADAKGQMYDDRQNQQLASSFAFFAIMLARMAYKVTIVFVYWCGYLFGRPVPTLLWTAFSVAVFAGVAFAVNFLLGEKSLSPWAVLIGFVIGGGFFMRLEDGSHFLMEKEAALYQRLPAGLTAFAMISTSCLIPPAALYALFWFFFVSQAGHSFPSWQVSFDMASLFSERAPWIIWPVVAMWSIMLIVGLRNRRHLWLAIYHPRNAGDEIALRHAKKNSDSYIQDAVLDTDDIVDNLGQIRNGEAQRTAIACGNIKLAERIAKLGYDPSEVGDAEFPATASVLSGDPQGGESFEFEEAMANVLHASEMELAKDIGAGQTSFDNIPDETVETIRRLPSLHRHTSAQAEDLFQLYRQLQAEENRLPKGVLLCFENLYRHYRGLNFSGPAAASESVIRFIEGQIDYADLTHFPKLYVDTLRKRDPILRDAISATGMRLSL
jgi:hypothetical protein